MTDLLGPASLPNSTTVQPAETRSFGGNDTWLQDCPPGTTSGGTFLGAQFFNALLAQLRALIRGMGITVNNANPNMLLTAVQMAGLRAPYGVDSGAFPNVIVVNLTPPLQQAPAAGDCIRVKMVNPCLGATSLDTGPYGPIPLTHGDGSALVANDYMPGQILDLRFDGTNFQIGRSSAPGAGSVTSTALAAGAAPLPLIAVQPNDNLHLANDGTNATRDINVAAGRVRDDSDVTNIQIAAAMGKRLDQAWAAGGAVGSSQGACDSGTKGNSQTWHIYAIGKLGLAVTQFSRAANVASLTINSNGLGVGGTIRVTGVGNGFDGLYPITAVGTNFVSYANGGANVATTNCAATADGFDILASQAYPNPTMPAGWTAKQCLGSVVTDSGGNIRAFTQAGDRFFWTSPVNDIANISTQITRISYPLTVPSGLAVLAQFRAGLAPSNAGVNATVFTALTETDVGPSGGGPGADLSAVASAIANGDFERLTSTTAQIGARSQTTSGTFALATTGWRDPRRRLF